MDNDPFAPLRAFALKALAADKYPHARHHCRAPTCPACGPAPLEVTVETHTGSRKGNFRGVVRGRCARCGSETQIFRFTGPQREPEGQETLSCRCGGSAFWLMICERLEGEDGLPGFFDEGVVAGRCPTCGRHRMIVAYD